LTSIFPDLMQAKLPADSEFATPVASMKVFLEVISVGAAKSPEAAASLQVKLLEYAAGIGEIAVREAVERTESTNFIY